MSPPYPRVLGIHRVGIGVRVGAFRLEENLTMDSRIPPIAGPQPQRI